MDHELQALQKARGHVADIAELARQDEKMDALEEGPEGFYGSYLD